MTSTRRHFLTGLGGTVCLPLLPQMAAATPTIALPTDLTPNSYSTIAEVRTQRPQVALTFDDGPHPRLTPRLLDMLAAANAKATFYLIGNRVRQWPQIARRIAEEGHEIGNHSWSHPFLDKYSDAGVLNEIDRTSSAIFDATGKAPITFRPPYGAFTARQREMLFAQRKLPSILWSVDPRDWRRPGAAVVARRILDGTHQGSIILSHDIQSGTVEAMPTVLNGLNSRGLQMVTMSDLMGWRNWSTLTFRRG